MKRIIIIITAIFFQCSPVIYSNESFFYEDPEIYHVSIYGDTTKLNKSYLSILKIDSLNNQWKLKN